MKGIYDAHECQVCQKEDEIQKHIYECDEIWKIRNKSHDEIPKYENILIGKVKEQLEVVRIFEEYLKVLERLRPKK